MRFGQIVPVVLPLLSVGLVFAAAPPKPLTIQNVTLSQYEDGPALAGTQSFVPGEAIFFSFQVSGYRSEGEDEQSIRLTWRIEAKDPAGVHLEEPATGKLVAGLAQEDKDWMPKVRHTIVVPPFAPSGTYHVTISVHDEIAKADVQKEAEFKVRGRQVEPSPKLAIRNMNFYRGEEDKEPAEPPAYRPGDTVWVRFDITGYRFAAKNHFDVGYGITVLRPNGEVTLSQPEAAAETDESFYPKPYIPAALSLNLPKDIRPGQYTVIVTAKDKVGGQNEEVRRTFSVEQ